MSKLDHESVLIKYLQEFGDDKIDLSCENTKKFMTELANEIIGLAVTAAELMQRNGINPDPHFMFITMAALGNTMKEIAEKQICELEGGHNEKDFKSHVPNNVRKLRNVH